MIYTLHRWSLNRVTYLSAAISIPHKTSVILHPYLPIIATSLHWPLSLDFMLAFAERFNCTLFNYLWKFIIFFDKLFQY